MRCFSDSDNSKIVFRMIGYLYLMLIQIFFHIYRKVVEIVGQLICLDIYSRAMPS